MTDASTNASPKATAALEYARKGYRVIVLHGVNEVPEKGITCTCRDAFDCKSKGKHPRDNEWQKQAPLTEEQILEAFPETGFRAASNVGIATGAESGFWVFDIDPDSGGLDSAKRLAEEYPGEWERTAVVKTGSGGFHYYFALPEGFEITNAKHGLKPYPGIDVRGNGGQVVAPPSVTDKGGYRLLVDEPVGAAPAWMLDLLTPKVSDVPMTTSSAEALPAVDDLDPAEARRLAAYADVVRKAEIARLDRMREATVADGQQYVGEPWNETTFKVACNLVELANASWNTYTLAEAGADVAGHAPTDALFTQRDVQTRWDSAVETIGDRARTVPPKRDTRLEVLGWDMPNDLDVPPGAPADPRAAAPEDEWTKRPKNDLGNGLRMVDHFADRLIWVTDRGRWQVYDDGRWGKAEDPIVRGLVHDLFQYRLARTEALGYDDTNETDANGVELPGTSERAAFLRWVYSQQMAARMTAAVGETKARSELHRAMDDFNAKHMLLCVRNGVVDMETGALLDHDPKHLLTQRSEVTYDPTAACHEWQRFLDRVMPDQEMQQYLQRIVGYSLTGRMDEQAFFIHHGAGANGKSVFLQVVGALAGEYGQIVPRDTLLEKKNAEHPTSLARMHGMRFLQVSETAPGKRLDEEAVKQLTGGEKISAREMRENFFDFTPTGKIHYVTNHLPLLSDAQSIWRRLHIVRWGVVIPKEEQDAGLAQRLIDQELPGILAWAVRGTQSWLQNPRGLDMPEAAKVDLRAYRSESDTFGDFLKEYTEVDEDARTPLKEIYFMYRGWATNNGLKPVTSMSFSAVLRERDFKLKRGAGGAQVVFGLRLTQVQAPAALPWDQ